MTDTKATLTPANALPFWLSLAIIPITGFAAVNGGWWLALIPLSTWGLFSALDRLLGRDTENTDPETPEDDLFWHKLITLIWFPVQFLTIFAAMWYATTTTHLSGGEKLALFFGIGVISGTIGINYSHELMHQKNQLERWLADLLLASVL